MNGLRRLYRHPMSRVATAAALLLPLSAVHRPAAPTFAATHAATSGCQLASAGNAIKHVINIQFDNTHFTRDNLNVPSDLEQMPHLLSFIENNGALLANHHTPLISHTSEDILTSLTGVYPNRHGVAVGQNSYQYYNQSGSPKSYTTAFTYWTDTIGNGAYNMLSGPVSSSAVSGTNAPAPWVPYTRAGCDVGAVASANQVLENANVTSPYGANDITTVFGANSPEAAESSRTRYADFVGIAVHCSQADSTDGKVCSSANHGRPDVLPDEPGGYSGFNALYGNKYVAPQVTADGGVTVTDTTGNPITNSDTGTAGFPGFDPTAAQSLGYVAAMQEHGVPVTYAYIADAHDQHPEPAAGHTALGPGEQTYVQQLKAYDDAFAAFFQRLAHDGIDQSNTLFVFTADEGDHFTAGPPNNPDCTGATIDHSQNPPVVTPGNYCAYTKTPSNPTTPPGPPFGEVAVGLDGLLSHEQGLNNDTFTVGNDTAPGIYLNGNPAPADPSARAFERATGALTVTNPLSNRVDMLTQYLADPAEMNLLHMVTADPARTPTFTLFARPDYYVTATCSGGYNSAPPPTYSPSCVLEKPAYAWLHGNVQPDITTTWLGLVGPGVQHTGVDRGTWSDHTDIRPTMLALLGLKDDYTHDGRVLLEDLASSAVPSLQADRGAYIQLAQVYKQINAPVGALGLASLQISTAALESGTTADDSTYTNLEGRLASFASQRDDLAATMATILDRATVDGQTSGVDGTQALITRGNALLGAVIVLAANTGTTGPIGPTMGDTATATATAGASATATPSGTAAATATATPSATGTAVATGSPTVAASGTAVPTATGASTGGVTGPLPRYRHVFVVMMENHNYDQIIGNPAAPRINRLAQTYGLATNYDGVTHPSEPNYVASIGGNYFGIQDDAPYYTHTVAYPSVADQLEAMGLSWKTYQQSLPYPGYLGTSYPSSRNALYASKHNPFLNFASIQSNRAELRKIVPWSDLSRDLSTGRVPNLSYIVPDQCHDMHGTGSCAGGDATLIPAGDRTVGTLVDAIMDSPAWHGGNNAIVVTWDEDDFNASNLGCCDANPGGGHVATIVITNNGPRPLQDGTAYNHYSLLQTIQGVFRLGCLQYTCDTANVTPMARLFTAGYTPDTGKNKER